MPPFSDVGLDVLQAQLLYLVDGGLSLHSCLQAEIRLRFCYARSKMRYFTEKTWAGCRDGTVISRASHSWARPFAASERRNGQYVNMKRQESPIRPARELSPNGARGKPSTSRNNVCAKMTHLGRGTKMELPMHDTWVPRFDCRASINHGEIAGLFGAARAGFAVPTACRGGVISDRGSQTKKLWKLSTCTLHDHRPQ